MQRMPHRAGDVIIRQGAEGDYFYAIVTGKCSVTRETPLNKEGIKLAELGVGDTFVEWLGGQRWVWADPADAGAATRLRSAAAAHGGHATLFIVAHADSARAAARFTPLAGALARIHRELQRQFDPAGIFNPGRLLTPA